MGAATALAPTSRPARPGPHPRARRRPPGRSCSERAPSWRCGGWTPPRSGPRRRGHRRRSAGGAAGCLPRAGPAAADEPARVVRARGRLRPADRLAPRTGHQHRAPAGGARPAHRRGLQPHRPSAASSPRRGGCCRPTRRCSRRPPAWLCSGWWPSRAPGPHGRGCPTRRGTPSTSAAYLAVALAFTHQIAAGQDFVGHPVNRAPVVGALPRCRGPAWCTGACSSRCGPGSGTGCWSTGSSWRAPAWSASGSAAGGSTSWEPRSGQFLLWRFLAPGPPVVGPPLLPVRGPRPRRAADHGQGRRRPQCRARAPAARHPGARRGAVRPLHARQVASATGCC